jgi:putative FmdB family regulatory protein
LPRHKGIGAGLYTFAFCIKGLAVPIYAYRCADCGHTKDVLQKLSDPVLSTCPACGKDAFAKQLTAAGFQLKGSGWYVTDFRGGNSGAKSGAPAPAGEAAKSEPASAGASGSSTATSTSSDSGASAGGCGTSCACH